MNPNDPFNPNPNKYNPIPQQQAPYFPPMPAPEAQRSAIPKVIGILMIIFGSLGLLSGLFGILGNSGGEELFGEDDAFRTFTRMSQLFNFVGIGVSCLHLIGGLKCVGYKESAPKLAVAYALLNMITSIIWGVIVYAWLKPMLDGVGNGMGGFVGIAMLFGMVISLAWPIIVLSLMTRPAAKAACTNF